MKDEEGSLPTLAHELGVLEGRLVEFGALLEVVLVDDGSTDDTARVAAEWCDRAPRRRLVRHPQNRGFGAGLRTGVAATTGDVVVSYDADCAYPASDVLTLIQALADGTDVAAATPFAPGGEHDVPAFRLFLSRACSFAYRTALRGRARGVRTFTCAFRAYRGELVRGLVWRSDGFVAAAEILSRALLSGARVHEVPSSLRPRVAGVSKMRVAPTALAHLRLLSRLSFARRA
jgi:dolichol-phosphate mannosyltransferase